jgi:hypothetical protein
VVDRNGPRQPRPREAGREPRAGVAERVFDDGPGRVEVVERPEAMDDPDTKAVSQERAVPARPCAELRLVAAEGRQVVSAVIVEDEESAARAQDAIGLRDLARVDTPESGPWADDDVGRAGRRCHRPVAEET